MKNWISCLFLLFLATAAKANNEAGGQISTRYLSAGQQEVKITLWVDSTGLTANSINYSVQGNGLTTPYTASLNSSTTIGNALMENVYLDTVSFTTTGSYKFVYQSCCRSAQITNLVSPAQQNFYIYTQFYYSPNIVNSTPEFLNTPDFYAGLLDTFLHNPLAADIDNDAVIFGSGSVYGNNGQVIPFNFNPYPFFGWSFGIDSLNGEVHWMPSTTGTYVYTVVVNEWRNGTNISSSLREALINTCNGCKTTMSNDFMFQTDGWPNNGQHVLLNTYANTPYSITFSGTTSAMNANSLVMKMPSQPNVHQNKPVFTSVQTGQTVSGTFTWTPQTTQVNNDPYLGVLVGQEINATNQRRQKEKTIYIKVNPGQANGLNETEQQRLHVYPNPAQTTLRIDFNENNIANKYLHIVSMDGRVMFEHKPGTTQGTILVDVQNWANGVYILKSNFHDAQTVLIRH
jgi:hypothetical protein